MKKAVFLLIVVFSVFISSCVVEDSAQCITSLDCEMGQICVEGLCVEGQVGEPDNSTTPDNNTTQPDNNTTNPDTVDDSDQSDEESGQSDESEVSDETSDETVDETLDETQDTEDDSDQSDEESDQSDESEVSDETSDETVDEPVDETVDETPDETVDEAVDEGSDEDTAVPLTCATAGLTCGSNSHCDDGDGTPKCVCDTNYQDKDSNGTCLVSCSLWDCNESAFGAMNTCSDSSGVATCSCDPFDGYTGTHCDQCSYGYHLGGSFHDNECFEDNCEEAEDPFHGWLDCWGSQTCVETFGSAECSY